MRLQEPVERIFERINSRPMTFPQITGVARSASRMKEGCDAAETLAGKEEDLVNRCLRDALDADNQLDEDARDLLRQSVRLTLRQSTLALAADDLTALNKFAVDFVRPIVGIQLSPKALAVTLETLRSELYRMLPKQMAADLDTKLRPVARFFIASAALARSSSEIVQAAMANLRHDFPALLDDHILNERVEGLAERFLLIPSAELIQDEGHHAFGLLAHEHNLFEHEPIPFAIVQTLMAYLDDATFEKVSAGLVVDYRRAFERSAAFITASADLNEKRTAIIDEAVEILKERHGDHLASFENGEEHTRKDYWSILESAAIGTHPAGTNHLFDGLYQFDEVLAKARFGARFMADAFQDLFDVTKRHLDGSTLRHCEDTLRQITFFVSICSDVAEHGENIVDRAAAKLSSKYADQFALYPYQTAFMKWDWDITLYAVRYSLLPGFERNIADMFDSIGWVLANERFFDKGEMMSESFDLLEAEVKKTFTIQSLSEFLPRWKKYREYLEVCLALAGCRDAMLDSAKEEVRRAHSASMAKFPNAEAVMERDLNTTILISTMTMMEGSEEAVVDGMLDLRDAIRSSQLDKELLSTTFHALHKAAQKQPRDSAVRKHLEPIIGLFAASIHAMADIAENEVKILDAVMVALEKSYHDQMTAHAGGITKSREDMEKILYGAVMASFPGGRKYFAEGMNDFVAACLDVRMDPKAMNEAVTQLIRHTKGSLDRASNATLRPAFDEIEKTCSACFDLVPVEKEVVTQAITNAMKAHSLDTENSIINRKTMINEYRKLIRLAVLANLPGAHHYVAEELYTFSRVLRSLKISPVFVQESFDYVIAEINNKATRATRGLMKEQLAVIREYLILATELKENEDAILDGATAKLFATSGDFMNQFPRAKANSKHDQGHILWQAAISLVPGSEHRTGHMTELMKVVVAHFRNYDRQVMLSSIKNLQEQVSGSMKSPSVKKFNAAIDQTVKSFA